MPAAQKIPMLVGDAHTKVDVQRTTFAIDVLAVFTVAESLAGAANTENWVSRPNGGRWEKRRPLRGKLNSEGDPRRAGDPLGTKDQDMFKFSDLFPRMPDGWEHRGKGSSEYSDGILETSSGIGLLIYTKESYKDPELKLQCREPSLDNNSGVYVRIPNNLNNDPDLAIKSGYEIQIDNRGNRPGDASSFGEADFNPFHQMGTTCPVHETAVRMPEPNGKPSKRIIDTRPFGEWNDYHVTVKGNSFQVRLNGTSVFEDGMPYADSANVYPQGHLALQKHSKGKRVQFRNEQIRKL